MTLKEDFREIKSSVRDLRKFGFVVGGAFIVIGLIFSWQGLTPHNQYFLAIGVVLFVLAIISPLSLKFLHLPWMMLALLMGWIATRIILAILFYVVFTIIGFVGRLFGKEFLVIDFKTRKGTYWERRKNSSITKESLERQF